MTLRECNFGCYHEGGKRRGKGGEREGDKGILIAVLHSPTSLSPLSSPSLSSPSLPSYTLLSCSIYPSHTPLSPLSPFRYLPFPSHPLYSSLSHPHFHLFFILIIFFHLYLQVYKISCFHFVSSMFISFSFLSLFLNSSTYILSPSFHSTFPLFSFLPSFVPSFPSPKTIIFPLYYICIYPLILFSFHSIFPLFSFYQYLLPFYPIASPLLPFPLCGFSLPLPLNTFLPSSSPFPICLLISVTFPFSPSIPSLSPRSSPQLTTV